LKLMRSEYLKTNYFCAIIVLAAASPTLVDGAYAPPANVKPHFLHCQTPTLNLFRFESSHLGHLYFRLRLYMTSAYLLLTVNPYLGPRPFESLLLGLLSGLLLLEKQLP
jgi:hypothetical protein